MACRCGRARSAENNSALAVAGVTSRGTYGTIASADSSTRAASMMRAAPVLTEVGGSASVATGASNPPRPSVLWACADRPNLDRPGVVIMRHAVRAICCGHAHGRSLTFRAWLRCVTDWPRVAHHRHTAAAPRHSQTTRTDWHLWACRGHVVGIGAKRSRNPWLPVWEPSPAMLKRAQEALNGKQ